MKKFFYLLLSILAMLAILAGCGGGGSSPKTVLSGVVTGESGAVLPNVAISAGTSTTSTGTDGTYSLSVTPGANLKVSAAKPGSVSTFHIVSILRGQSLKVNFNLRAVGSSNSLTNMTSQITTATETRGSVITIPAGSIVDSTNTPVTSATVDVTTSLAVDTNYTENFPGLFVGTKEGTDTAIESFGIVTVDITSNGSKCNLGSGKTAEIAIPVSSGADPGTATIDLWSLDESTGKWIHEGIATRDESASPVVYRATVSHFSTYNLDRPIPSGTSFNVTVKDSSGNSVAGAALTVKSTGSDGAVWEGRGTTGADGTYRFATLPAGNLSITAKLGTLVGNGYSYTTSGSEATMEITIVQTVAKTFTLVYIDANVEKPAPNALLTIFSEGISGGHSFASGTTGTDGKVTLDLVDGKPFYNYNASATIGGSSYSANNTASSIGEIPTRLTLIKQ